MLFTVKSLNYFEQSLVTISSDSTPLYYAPARKLDFKLISDRINELFGVQILVSSKPTFFKNAMSYYINPNFEL